MSYCKYHPNKASLNHCPHCNIDVCETCTDEGEYGEDSRCLLCGKPMQHTGAPVDVVPFWRRIDKSFRYPLNKSVLIFLGAISFLTSLLSYLPGILTLGFNLALTGALLKYCFNCLHETAMGNMQAADITSAYQGGVSLFMRLLFILLLSIGAVVAAFTFVGHTFGMLMGIFLVFAFPAMIIVYAMSESVLDTVNPIKLIQLITAIGLPYGLILGIVAIMLGSVEFISEFIGHDDSIYILTLQSMISNYYAVVMFHIFGYMIFQYQDRLGFTSQYTHDDHHARPAAERDVAHLGLLTKEGRWAEVISFTENALKKDPGNSELQNRYFLFTLTSLTGAVVMGRENADDPDKGQANVIAHACKVFDNYLLFLINSGQTHTLRPSFLKITSQLKRYLPNNPRVRFELAKTCNETGSYKTTVSLINGLHKSHPDFPYLVSAYRLMLEALQAMPETATQAAQCEKLLEALEQRAESRRQNQKPAFSTHSDTPDPSPAAHAGAPEDNPGDSPGDEPEDDMKMIEFKL